MTNIGHAASCAPSLRHYSKNATYFIFRASIPSWIELTIHGSVFKLEENFTLTVDGIRAPFPYVQAQSSKMNGTVKASITSGIMQITTSENIGMFDDIFGKHNRNKRYWFIFYSIIQKSCLNHHIMYASISLRPWSTALVDFAACWVMLITTARTT